MVNKQRNDEGLRELALFAGAGGGILGGHLLGWRTVCAVECNAYARSVLLARQNDGTLPPFPVWDDVCTFDGKPWRGLIDVVSGGFPCQDISAAGKGAGLDGERSGLWGQMARIIGEVRPRRVFVENSPVLTSRGLGRVLGDLAEMGFDAEWGVISAADTGAPHQRERIWIVAHANGMRELQPTGSKSDERDGACQRGEALADAQLHRVSERRGIASIESQARGSGGISPDDQSGGEQQAESGLAHAMREREQRIFTGEPDTQERSESGERQVGPCGYGFGRWPTEPGLGRVAHGVANRADRIKAIGNGQVSRVAAAAWRLLA